MITLGFFASSTPCSAIRLVTRTQKHRVVDGDATTTVTLAAPTRRNGHWRADWDVATTHHRRLREDTGATIRVGALLARDGREGDRVLVVLAKVEVPREPGLDAAVLTHQVDELAALLLIMILFRIALILIPLLLLTLSSCAFSKQDDNALNHIEIVLKAL